MQVYLHCLMLKQKETPKPTTKPTQKEAMPEVSSLYILNPYLILCELFLKNM